MANTKLTIPIEKAPIGYIALGLALATLSALNLFWTLTPVAALNEKIFNTIESSSTLPVPDRLSLYSDLRQQQQKALTRKPAEAYGWARLSFLRLATQGNKKAAFEALRMSDLVSPYEPPQLPERAYMWSKFRDVETKEQQDYQDILWGKAYGLSGDATRQLAERQKIVESVGAALKRRFPSLYTDWKKHGL